MAGAQDQMPDPGTLKENGVRMFREAEKTAAESPAITPWSAGPQWA